MKTLKQFTSVVSLHPEGHFNTSTNLFQLIFFPVEIFFVLLIGYATEHTAEKKTMKIIIKLNSLLTIYIELRATLTIVEKRIV